MSEQTFLLILLAWICIAVAVFVSLFFIDAPYGRYFKHSFGPATNGKLAWILMEAPAPLLFVAFFIAAGII